APLQDWGEETEDGAVYNVSLRRQRSQRSTPKGPGDDQAPTPVADTFLQYRTSKVRALRAARLERLVHELVSGDREQDPGFVPAFLATHQAFVPTARVLGFLLPPPPPPPPPGSGRQQEGRGTGSELQQESEVGSIPTAPPPPAQGSVGEGTSRSGLSAARAVVSVLGSWLRDHPQDFWDPPAHQNLGNVLIFLGWAAPGGAEAREAEKLLEEFLEEAKGEQAEEEQRLAWAGPELLDFSVDEVAEQLTLMDVELFLRVRTCECLGSMWSQRDRPGAAGISPTVRATVAQFNAVTGCVLGSVLAAPGLAASQRAQRIEKWIRIAQRCRELRNFSSLRAILSALQSNPIYRLKRSWGSVSRKLSREKNSSPSESPGDPSSPTSSSVSPGSPPSSPRNREPPPGSPPASPGPQSSSNKMSKATTLPTPHCLQPSLNMDSSTTLTLSSPRIPLLGQQTSEARVIRVSIDNNHGNLYRSILRALEKHNVPQPWARDYQLFQVLPGDRELLIPDSANVFYAMNPTAPGDFLLRRKEGTRHTPSASPT
ncbi:hypothetical protein U0070_008267, partial [Myodes glareolus]